LLIKFGYYEKLSFFLSFFLIISLLPTKINAQLYSSGNNTISGNRVGVGTSTPNTSFFVKPPTHTQNASKITSPFHVQYYYNPVPPPGEAVLAQYKTAIFVKWDGKIGLNTDNPTEQIHLNGKVRGGAANGLLEIQSIFGSLRIGANNATYSHFITDRAKYYFNKKIIIEGGQVSSYNNQNLQLQTAETTRVTIEHTTGNLVLNGGNLILTNPNGLGTGNNQIALNSNGTIRAREVRVDLQTIPDYVFAEDYELMPLEELGEFVKTNKHLPGVKSESQFEEEGSISLTEMNLKLLEKVEELTLYILQQEKRILQLEAGR